jgi:hypothetical protein
VEEGGRSDQIRAGRLAKLQPFHDETKQGAQNDSIENTLRDRSELRDLLVRLVAIEHETSSDS